MKQAKGYVDVRYLQAAAALLEPIKTRSHELLQIKANHAVLDVGCGPGFDTLALAHLVGSTGRVVGVDYDESMVATASERAEQAGLTGIVRHQQADASHLPLGADQFDACRSERLFIHLADAPKALAEMIRVTKSGGRIVVVDTDWGTLSIDTEQPEIERKLARFGAEQSLQNGYAGRQLYRLFKECQLTEVEAEVWPVKVINDATLARYLAKLDDVEREAVATGIVTQNDLEIWHDGLAQAEHNGTFFATLSMVIAVGRKP